MWVIFAVYARHRNSSRYFTLARPLSEVFLVQNYKEEKAPGYHQLNANLPKSPTGHCINHTVLQEVASMRVSTARSTMAACVICGCVLIFIPSARADITPGAISTKYPNEDHHDRLPSVASIAQRLQVQHNQDQRRATSAGAVEGTDASHDRFYDATSWSDDDVSFFLSMSCT